MMRLLGIEVAPDEVRVARAERRFGALRLLGVERLPAADDVARAEALAGVARWQPHRVLTALPAARVTHRIFTLPFRDRRRVARAAPLELLGQLPLDPDDVVVACEPIGTSDDGTAVLGAVARRADVDALRALLAAAGIAPARIDLAPLPAWNLLPAATDAALLVADGARSAVSIMRGGRLAGLRALGTSAGDVRACAAEVRWTLGALGGSPSRLVVAGPDASPALVEALTSGIAVESLDSPCAVAAGLVAGAGRRNAIGLGLASAPHAAAEAPSRIVALGLLVLALGALDLGLLRVGLARRDAALVAAVQAEAAAALPGVRLVAPRAQLEAAVGAAGRRHAGAGSVLDVIREVSARTPPGLRLDLDEVTVDGDHLLVHGRCEGFDAVDGLRRALGASPLLGDVATEETRASVDGRSVEFRLRATRRAAGETSS